MKKHVLLLEDDLALARGLKRDFEERDYKVTTATRIRDIPKDLVFSHAVVDLRLSGGESGLDGISHLLISSPGIKIAVLSGYGSITTAVEALKRGAVDYLTKPVSFSEIEQALNETRVKPESDFKRRSLSEVENEYIDFVLTKNAGNISKTAKDLGLHRQSLQRKLKKYT
jgi:two-component system response regulator RegA